MSSLRERVVMTILNNLPSIATKGGVNFEFFLHPETFPCGDDLGSDREGWSFGISWVDGLGECYEPVEVVYFDYENFDLSKFDGSFSLNDKFVQILGDYDPLRGLLPEELNYIKSALPQAGRLFVVGAYRPSTNRKKGKVPAIGLDGVVIYHATSTMKKPKRIPNPLQLLAVPPAPVDEPQKGSQKGESFIRDLLS